MLIILTFIQYFSLTTYTMDNANLYQNFDTIRDCFGMDYKVLKMRGSGFCLYHSLSYSLTGNDEQYVGIINDCLTVFHNIPELFRLRTNFGSYCDSSLTVDDYALYMQQAIQLIQADHSVDSHAYGDEGHIAAIALLYDITVFTYYTQNKSWYVFNELAQHGYICLLNLPDHFDVLSGTAGPPVIPFGAHTVGVNRCNFSTSADAWKTLQRNCSYQYVYRFPQQYSGVQILNNPVVAYKEICPSSNVTADECTNTPCLCDYSQCNYTATSPQALSVHKFRCHSVNTGSSKNNSSHRQKDAAVGCKYMCDFEQCEFFGKNSRSLQIHKTKCHTVVHVSKISKLHKGTKQLQTTITGTNNAYFCDYDQCNYTGKSQQSLSMHKLRCHRGKRASAKKNSFHKAKKRTVSYTDRQSECHLSRKVQHLYDTSRRGLQHEMMADLTNKFRRQNKSHRCVEVNIEPDNTSVSSVISCDSGLRRSARISNRQSKCDKINVSESNKSTSKNAVNINNRGTKKIHMKKSFSRVISECEKKFIPTTVSQQSDPLYDRLKAYHDDLLRSVSNTTTEKISAEILDVVENVSLIDTSDRRYLWPLNDEQRLNELNRICKLLQPRTQWTWGAPDDTEQGQYNDKRMQLCVTKECEWKIIECINCDSTGILVGDQTDSEVCYDCLKLYRVSEKEREKREEAWNKVKPTSKDFPKAANGTDLPSLSPGEKAIIAPVHPVVTIKKNHYADKRLRLECISLMQDPVPTWVKTLPRTSLVSRFMIIERRVKQCTKYIVANADHVRQLSLIHI